MYLVKCEINVKKVSNYFLSLKLTMGYEVVIMSYVVSTMISAGIERTELSDLHLAKVLNFTILSLKMQFRSEMTTEVYCNKF